MRITANATTDYVRARKTPGDLRNLWYDMYYHPSRYARGKGSRTYVRELAAFADNLAVAREGYSEYLEIAERCAARAEKLRTKFEEAPKC